MAWQPQSSGGRARLDTCIPPDDFTVEPAAMPSFETFLRKLNPNVDTSKRLLVFDPGETSGVAHFDGVVLTFSNQIPTKPPRKDFPHQFQKLVEYLRPTMVLYENYRVYSWRRDQHSFAELHTPKLIGQIEALSIVHNLPFHTQMAHQAKQFCTDDKLKMWGLYKTGSPHARDAIRHGCYFLLFGNQPG